MSEPFVPRVGAIFSADIAVPEYEREMRFYGRVLSTGEHPLWREEDLMNNLSMPIIGLGARSADYARLPLQRCGGLSPSTTLFPPPFGGFAAKRRGEKVFLMA